MLIRRLFTVLSAIVLGIGVVLAVAAIFLGPDVVEEGIYKLYQGPFEPPESLPPAPPGSPLVITLSDVPQSRYGPSRPTTKDTLFRRLAQAKTLEYDASLGAAARELAVFYGDYRRLATSNALGFLLESAGATYWGVRQSVVITNAQGNGPIETLLAESSATGDVVGLGEDVLPEDPPQRVIVALSAQRTLRIDPLPRTFTPGVKHALTGQLSPGYHSPTAIAMSLSGDFRDLVTTSNGRRFTIQLPTEKGQWVIEILAKGPHGPVPLTQLTLYGDTSVPTIFESTWPPTLAKVTSGAEYVFDLVNRSRLEAGRQPLTHDSALADVARAHSADMMTGQFVGHRSPTTGLLTNRLQSTGYRSVSRGENVALNGSLFDAHAGLMWSLGHRKNILSPEFTHLGIGVVHGSRGWYVTEVFTRPTPVIDDPEAAAYGLLEQIRDARSASGDSDAVVRRDPTLFRIARAAAKIPSNTPKEIVSTVREIGIGARTTVWTGQLATLEQFNPPAAVVKGEFARFGVGIAQDMSSSGPSVRVVLIAAEAR